MINQFLKCVSLILWPFCAIFLVITTMELVNQLIKCENATKMQCKATIVEFDPNNRNDAELIAKLQLENPNSYGWLCGSRIERHHNDATLRLLQEIEELKPGVSPYFAANRPNQRIYKIDVAGQTYEVLGTTLRWYAQAIDLSRYFLYRCSQNGEEIEFYAEKKELTPKQHAFHSAYYDTVYAEHFEPLSYPANVLTLFHDGYEFIHQNERITLLCRFENGCKAKLDKSYRYGQIVVNFTPHDDDVAHNHGLAAAPASAAVPLVRIPVHNVRADNGWFGKADVNDGRINKADLSNADFTVVVPAADKWGNYIRDPISKHVFYIHKSTVTTGITTYRCENQRWSKCKARAFHKEIAGVDYIKADVPETHNESCKIKE